MKESQVIPVGLRVLMALAMTAAAAGVSDFVAANWSRPAYDLFFNLRGAVAPSDDVVIVAIDEPSFGQLDQQWPWPRSIHARLIDRLYAAGARAVALDITFSEPTTDDEDAALAKAVEAHPTVVLPQDLVVLDDPLLGITQTQIMLPTPIMSRMSKPPILGFVSIAPDADGYLRRVRTSFPDGPAFSLAAVEAYLSTRPGETRTIESENLPDFELINFAGPARTIPTVSYYQALDPEAYLPKGVFEGKLVFVGTSASSEINLYNPTADHFLVPFTRMNGASMPGVEVHANSALSLLNDRYIKPLPMERAKLLGALAALLSAALFLTVRPVIATILYVAIAAFVSAGAFIAFVEWNRDVRPVFQLLPLTISYLGCALLTYYYTYKQKAFIRKAFSTYLSPRLVNELIANPDRLELGGEEIEGTVVFLDLAGFTAFSEKLKPKELIELINRNLGACAEVILKNDGMIDKYIGDCIMAIWGVPIATPDHAVRACSAVLEIQNEMKILTAKEHALTGINLSVRVGLNTGLLVAGNVGGGRQFNYTVLGNEVNLASRLEGINKFYGTDVVLSESTAKRLGGEFILRELDIIRVVGQRMPTKIYQLWGKGALDPVREQLDAVFQEGRALYLSREFKAATERFTAALALAPDDGPSKKFILRCEEYSVASPPPDWDGVYQMLSK